MDEEEIIPEDIPAAVKSVPKIPAARSVPKIPPVSRPMRGPSSGDSMAVQVLYTVRQPIADLQAARGLSRNEDYSFVNLITSLCHHTYNAAINIFDMMCNLLPLFDGFLYFLRFVLEKLIDIFETTELQEKIVKSLLLAAELIVLFLLLFFIMSVLLFPLFSLAFHFLRKILNVAFGH